MREDSGGTNLRSEDLMCQSAFGQRKPHKALVAQPGQVDALGTREFSAGAPASPNTPQWGSSPAQDSREFSAGALPLPNNTSLGSVPCTECSRICRGTSPTNERRHSATSPHQRKRRIKSPPNHCIWQTFSTATCRPDTSCTKCPLQ